MAGTASGGGSFWAAAAGCAALWGAVGAAACSLAALCIVAGAIPAQPMVVVFVLLYACLGYLIGCLGGVAAAGLGGVAGWAASGFLAGGVIGSLIAGFPSTRHTLATLWETSGPGIVFAAVVGAVAMGALGDAAGRGSLRWVRPGDLAALRTARGRWRFAAPAVGLLSFALSGVFMSPRDSVAASRGAVRTLRYLWQAEETYRKQHGTYAPVSAVRGLLAGESGVELDENGLEPRSGYRFAGPVGTDTYTLIATPPRADGDTYTLTETGNITP